MQLSPIGINQPYNITCKANNRWIYNSYGKELYKTTTYFFREDLDWKNLINYLCEKYKNVPKVNFINHACSNGMEPFSFLASFIMYAPEYVKKFTPIIAKDINPENILMAKKGECGASSDDFMRIHRLTYGRYKDFFNLKRDCCSDGLFTMYPKEVLTDKVIFEEGDIFKDIDSLPKDNTFLSCRNFWAYLPDEKREELAYKLSQQLNPSSTVLIGYHDLSEGNADILLKSNGFKRCPTGTQYVNLLYQKV